MSAMTDMARVLLVDDESTIRAALREFLLEEGIDVIGEACDGREGVSTAVALHPDVVLMDLRMPLMDGIEATQAIKDQCPDIRIVVLTAYEDTSLRDRARLAGADAYVVKGTSIMAILEMIYGWTRGPAC